MSLVPYAEGELLARVRERGTVEMRYLDGGVHVIGRVAPALAGELRAAAARVPTAAAGQLPADTAAQA